MLVEIRNFQAISEASFEIDGFTALVGRSNIGKSAAVRALKCALTGAEGTDFVRHDPKTCARILKGNQKCKCFSSVKLTDDGWALLWEKGDSCNQYTTWDAAGVMQVYTRVGKNPEMPPILQGFDTVKIGDRTRELIQVSDQFSPIFLLNITGTAVADLLSDVAQLDDINLAMRLVTKDRKDASATRKVREKDVLDLEQGLKVYNTLDNTARRVERVETLHADLTTKESQVRQVDSFLVRASGVTQSIKGLKDALQGDLPEAQGLSGKASRLKEVSGFFKAIQERALVIRDLKGVDDIEVPALGSLRERIQRLKELGSQLAKLRALKEALEKFQGFDAVALPAKLGASEVLSRLEALDRYLDRLATMQASILKLEQDLDVATEEEATVLAEFDALGVCPTCTQKVGPGHKENHA